MKECYKSRWRCTEGYSPTLSFLGGKPEDTTHDVLEEVSLQSGTSPRAPFRFTQSSRLPSIQSLSPEGRWAHLMTPDTLSHSHQSDSRGGWRWPTSVFLCLEWITYCQHVPGWSWRMNHWSCGLGTRGNHLVLLKMITQRGAPYTGARVVRFSLTGPII